MRVTNHNGRKGKDGVYSVKHNDRNFDTKNARHIDAEKTKDNWNWKIYKNAKSNDECEHLFYEKHFGKLIEERNQRYIEQRHPERCQTIDQYRQNEKFCPEETIYQIGNKDSHIDPDTLRKISLDLMQYEQQKYPQLKYLDIDLHVDEEGAPHIHARKVWIAHDKDGRETISQNKALQEMGVERPDPEKEQSRYNNPKMTYTADVRNKFIEICHEHGIEIEREPLEKSKTGLTLEQYKTRQEQERAEQLREEQKSLAEQNEMLQESVKTLEQDKTTLTHEKEQIEGKIKALEPQSKEVEQLESKKAGLTEQIHSLNERIKAEHQELQRNAGMREFLKTREELVNMNVEIKKRMDGKTVTNLTPQQLESLVKTSDALERQIYEVKHQRDMIRQEGVMQERQRMKPELDKMKSIDTKRYEDLAKLTNENNRLKKIISHFPETEVQRVTELIRNGQTISISKS